MKYHATYSFEPIVATETSDGSGQIAPQSNVSKLATHFNVTPAVLEMLIMLAEGTLFCAVLLANFVDSATLKALKWAWRFASKSSRQTLYLSAGLDHYLEPCCYLKASICWSLNLMA